VVDLSQGIAGPYCTKLLADSGAEVIKVEPPHGDLSRRAGPFPGDLSHPEMSGRYLHLNTGKESVTLDLADAADRAAPRRLLAGADLFVESFEPGYLAALGLGYADLKDEFSGLIELSVTPFGQTGPYRHYKASAFLILALTGVMYQSGDPDREPLATAGDRGRPCRLFRRPVRLNCGACRAHPPRPRWRRPAHRHLGLGVDGRG
jgi:crotonobetainyl-CoA:carnitine CoA-transferase CaiB-like acyl-CoA transferase